MKNKLRFKVLIAVYFGCCILSANAQNNSEKKNDHQWHQLYTTQEVEVKYKYSECSLPEWGTEEENAYLQIKNLTSQRIKFTWSPTLWYGDKCYNCQGTDPEMTYTITLAPGQVLEGTCSTTSPRYLKIFSRYLNVAQEGVKRELKDFQINNNAKVESAQ